MSRQNGLLSTLNSQNSQNISFAPKDFPQSIRLDEISEKMDILILKFVKEVRSKVRHHYRMTTKVIISGRRDRHFNITNRR